jgi:hypothetical protein
MDYSVSYRLIRMRGTETIMGFEVPSLVLKPLKGNFDASEERFNN